MSADKTTPGKTTVKVSKITGAAKDEIFAGISEDGASVNLDVLANDPGSAKIWSLDQLALNAPAGSQQPQALAPYTLASGAVISVNADGTVRYEGANNLQSLAEGEVFNDSFIYTIRMANGALSTATSTVGIVGKNDVAVFSGDFEGSVVEDGTLSASGAISVSDVDHDQSVFASTGNLAGTYGDFTFDLDSGEWTYALRNAAANVQALAAGDSVQDTLQISSADGTQQTLVVTIGGADEVVVADPIKWTATPARVTHQELGVVSAYNNRPEEPNIAFLDGFDGDDTLHTTSLLKSNPFIVLYDSDGVDGVDSTLLNFTSPNNQQRDIVLVGYMDFDPATQLFMQQSPV